MPAWITSRLRRRLAESLRVLAGVAFIGFAGLVYLDSQEAAERRIARLHDAPPPQPISQIAPPKSGAPLVEVQAVAVASAPRTLRLRQGLSRQTRVLYPLLAPSGADATVLGFALVPASASGEAAVARAAASGVWPGLLEPRPTVTETARRALEDAGQPLATETPVIALFDAPRDEVLARPVRSPWRPFLAWLAAVAFLGSYVARALTISTPRAAAGRTGNRLTADGAEPAGAGTAPDSAPDNARFPFDELTDDVEPPEPALSGTQGRLAAVWQRLEDWTRAFR